VSRISPACASSAANSLKQGKKQRYSLISADSEKNRSQKPNDSSRFRQNSLRGRTGTFFRRAGNSNSLLGQKQGYLAPLAYTLPFTDAAKQHVAALLEMYPTMTIPEADAFYKLAFFEPAFLEKIGALRQAGLPE
jgi:hypothetical protein